jgi:SAM-dependent methyltransferase
MPFEDFVRAQLPPAPARVLEVGAGAGELTTALAVAGYDPLGIDPAAPPGDRLRRLVLEDLGADEGPFDAVVASHALHTIRDLDGGLEKVAALLRPGGVLVVEEPAWDRMDEPTLDWLHGQRRALAAAGRGEPPAGLEQLGAEWEADHLGLHGGDTLRTALARRFDERAFTWVAALHRTLGGVASEVLEQALVDAEAIQPLAFRFAGSLRQE